MKYIATEECIMFGKVGPFEVAYKKDGKLYSTCHQCLEHTCRIAVREVKQ